MKPYCINKNNYLTIPAKLRKHYNMQAGTKIIFGETENGILIRPMNEEYFKSFAGVLKGNGRLKEG